jgi:hypothetical protein
MRFADFGHGWKADRRQAGEVYPVENEKIDLFQPRHWAEESFAQCRGKNTNREAFPIHGLNYGFAFASPVLLSDAPPGQE